MKCVITVDRGVRQDQTVNVFLLNFCKFDHKKSRENANCAVMISKLYGNGRYSTVCDFTRFSSFEKKITLRSVI